MICPIQQAHRLIITKYFVIIWMLGGLRAAWMKVKVKDNESKLLSR